MNLNELITKEEIIEETVKHPSMRIKRKTGVEPDLDTALKVAATAVEYVYIRKVTSDIKPKIEELLADHIDLYGEFDDVASPDERAEWEAELDNTYEALLAPYQATLSADWLGRNTIDCGIQGEGGVERAATSFAREMFKQLTASKSPAKILSSAGLARADIEKALKDTINEQKKGEEPMQEENDELGGVIAAIAEHVGKAYDIMSVYDDLDLASDEDDGLALGAGARLGLDADQVRVLQCLRMEHDDETATKLQELLDAKLSGKAPKAAKKAAAPKSTPKKEATLPEENAPVLKAKAKTKGEAFDTEVFNVLKNSGGAKDADIAASIGVSRQTYNNWVNGKSECVLNEEQADIIRESLVERINALGEAVNIIDGLV